MPHICQSESTDENRFHRLTCNSRQLQSVMKCIFNLCNLSKLSKILIVLPLPLLLYSAGTSKDNLLIHDIGITRILSPPMGGVPPGDYDWIVRVQNLGDFPETGNIHAYIWDTVGMTIIFDQYYTLTNFPPGGDTAIQFNTIIPVPNYYYCEAIAGFGDDNPANDTLTVRSFVPDTLGQHIYWIDAQTPTGSMALFGVEFDGTYFYLTGVTNIHDTKIFVIDTLGNLVWTIDQPPHSILWGWRDMAFDRVYVGPDRIDTLYASCDLNIDRFGINKMSGTLDYYGPLPGPINPSRPLAYQPDSLYFYTSDQDLIYKFIKNGSFIYPVPAPCLMFGATYDCDTIGGDKLWWSTTDTLNQQFRQFNPNTMSFTSYSFGCDYPSSGLGFAQDFRGMDVLFSIVNEPQADHIYGFFLRWSDSTSIEETTPKNHLLTFGFIRNNVSLVRHSATLTYHLPASHHVLLNLYDCTGRHMKTLVQQYQISGTHTVLWNGCVADNAMAANGIYFVELEAGNRVDIQKLIILR